MSEAKEVIVAGCGASGMMAAIAAALSGARVTVLEGMERPGKKLLLTGNGRCNLTNLDPDLPVSYRSVEPEGAEISERILKRFSVEDTLDFFMTWGYIPRTGNSMYIPEPSSLPAFWLCFLPK